MTKRATNTSGWKLNPDEVVTDLRRILRSTERVQRTTSDPVVRISAARNADTLRHAIALLERTP